MTTIAEYADSKKVELDGVQFTVRKRDNRITWMSDWTQAAELEKIGVFSHRFYRDIYSHTEYFLVE